MRLRLNYPLILLILLLACNNAFAAVYLRPCAGTKVPISSGLCSPADQWDSSQALYYDPGDMPAYVAASGLVATSDHTHDIASRGEGAVADGTWHSLLSQGYTTVAAARARWPYLTSDGTLLGVHYVQTEADLSALGIDRVATQSAVNRACSTGNSAIISYGQHILEGSITTPASKHVDIRAESLTNSILTPKEGTFTVGAYLLDIGQYCSISVQGVTFLTNTYLSTSYNAIRCGAYAGNILIDRCKFTNLSYGAVLTASYNRATITNNDYVDCGSPIHMTTGPLTEYASGPLIADGNTFYATKGKSAGIEYGYAITFATGCVPRSIQVRHNTLDYHLGLIRQYDTTTGQTTLFFDISDNILTPNGQPIVMVNEYFYTCTASNNHIWYMGADALVFGGMDELLVNGNIASKMTGHMIKLVSGVITVSITGNVIDDDRRLLHYEMLSPMPFTSGLTKLSVAGNASGGIFADDTGNGAYLAYIKGGVAEITDVGAGWFPTIPLDAAVVTQFSAGNIALWDNAYMIGKKYKIVNLAGVGLVSVTGSITDQNGNTVTSLPVPYRGSVELIHVSWGWREI